MTPTDPQVIARSFEHERVRQRRQKPARVRRLHLADGALDVIGEIGEPAFAAPDFPGFRLADIVAGLSLPAIGGEA